eukprot:gene3001-2121_t
MMKACMVVLLLAAGVCAKDIVIATFDGANPKTTLSWQELNDPVMGGKSTGTFTVANSLGNFVGDVVNVPFLKAPGFIKAEGKSSAGWPDVSN